MHRLFATHSLDKGFRPSAWPSKTSCNFMTSPHENSLPLLSEAPTARPGTALLRPIEAVCALLNVVIVVLLLVGVISRYVFSSPVTWIDEVISIAFLWVAMLGAVLAIDRNEHLRLNLFVEMLPPAFGRFVQTFALIVVASFLLFLLHPAWEYVKSEWMIRTPALDLPNGFRVSAIGISMLLMLLLTLRFAWSTGLRRDLFLATALVASIIGVCWLLSPSLQMLGNINIPIFLIGFVAVCLVAGVPIAFCFGVGTLCFIAFGSTIPTEVIINRMDEGMSSLVLVSVPIFVLLGCVLDATGMGKAIIDFLASLIGHVKAGMSYVLLGSLFIVSGISGSKVSDMATVAPALFPEMKRRGHKPREMIALLATGAAMADTVPPSIVLIVLGSVAGVSIAGLFNSGVVVAMVLLVALAALARWKARHEKMDDTKHAPLSFMWRTFVVAAPALLLPFLIRGAVGGGVATATEVSTLAVLYAMLAGMFLYGGIGLRKIYDMLVETAALTGAILIILGTALSMAWVIAQSGVAQQLATFMTTLPGGWIGFMAVTIIVFLVLGCLLEGLPAILLLAPLMFPIAKKLGINDVHYAMVVVTAMNIGLMMPPIGVGFYVACRIGNVSPDEAMGAIWPYIVALIAGLLAIAFIPTISTFVL
jgi:tripartite ATP-independent transporter DctM subunit